MVKSFHKLAQSELVEALRWDDLTFEKLNSLGKTLLDVISNDGCVYAMGNGGSAADAEHFIGEFTSKCKIAHKPWKGICLNSNISAITSIANDFNYDEIFSRQLEAHFRVNDMLIALSTSGTSPNILRAIELAGKISSKNTFFLTSNKIKSFNNLSENQIIRVPSQITSRIQEVHMHWLHSIIEFCEQNLEINSGLSS
jgi:D-sedoheptulose 7-phosphate isomerase